MLPPRALAAGHFELNDWQVIPVTNVTAHIAVPATAQACGQYLNRNLIRLAKTCSPSANCSETGAKAYGSNRVKSWFSNAFYGNWGAKFTKTCVKRKKESRGVRRHGRRWLKKKRDTNLKLPRCPHSVAATLATLPSISSIPSARFTNCHESSERDSVGFYSCEFVELVSELPFFDSRQLAFAAPEPRRRRVIRGHKKPSQDATNLACSIRSIAKREKETSMKLSSGPVVGFECPPCAATITPQEMESAQA